MVLMCVHQGNLQLIDERLFSGVGIWFGPVRRRCLTFVTSQPLVRRVRSDEMIESLVF